MQQLIAMPRSTPCTNCTGRTRIEFDQLNVSLSDGRLLQFLSVPYYQCRECDHRQMHAPTQERLGQGVESFLREIKTADQEIAIWLKWRDVIDLGAEEESDFGDRIFEVEWSLT